MLINELSNLTFFIAPVFYKLLFLSVTAIMAGAVLLIIRKVFDKKISPAWKYVMWICLLVALIVPLRVESNISIMSATNVQQVENVSFRNQYQAAEYNYTVALQQENPTFEQQQELVNLESQKQNLFITSLTFDILIPLTWALGSMLIAAFMFAGVLRIKRKIKSTTIDTDMSRYNHMLAKGRKKLNIKKDINVVVQSYIKTPALYGFFKPQIVLPEYSNELSDESVECVILHELSHYRRFDHIVNFLILALQTVYWFNPITWILLKLLREDLEVANDSSVLKNMNKDEQNQYCLSLVEVLMGYNKPALMPKILCMVENKKNIERRIKMIQLSEFFKKRRIIISITSLVVICTVSVLFLTVKASDIINVEQVQDIIDTVQLSANAVAVNNMPAGDEPKAALDSIQPTIKPVAHTAHVAPVAPAAPVAPVVHAAPAANVAAQTNEISKQDNPPTVTEPPVITNENNNTKTIGEIVLAEKPQVTNNPQIQTEEWNINPYGINNLNLVQYNEMQTLVDSRRPEEYWKRDIKIIAGAIPKDQPRITINQAKTIIENLSNQSLALGVKLDFFELTDAFDKIHGAPDAIGGSGIQHAVYFLNNEATEYIMLDGSPLGCVEYVFAQKPFYSKDTTSDPGVKTPLWQVGE